MITVFFPSRGRRVSLAQTINILLGLAADRARVEIWVAADPDDYATVRVAENLGRWWADRSLRQPVRYLHLPVRHGYRNQQEYYNQMLPLTSGEWLMLWGDDARMQTRGWDQVIRAQAAAVLHPESNGYPYCFPVVPAAWARALGRFSPSAHPDSYWYSVGKGLDRHAEIPVKVLHERKDLTGGHDDQTYAEGRALIGPSGMFDDGGAETVAKDVEVIRRLLCAGG